MKREHLTEEHKKKIAQAHKGKKLSEEHKKHLSEAKKGKPLSNKQKQQIKDNAKKRTGTKKYTNGEIHIYLKPGEKVPKGFWPGSSEKTKQNQRKKHKPLSQSTKDKMSQSRKGRKVSHKTRDKLSKAISQKRYYRNSKGDVIVLNVGEIPPKGYTPGGKPRDEEFKKRMSQIHLTKSCQEKTNISKRKNNTFNTSKPEDKYYEFLCLQYGKDDVIRQYDKDERYPFNCDFYIISLDKFIELNLHWTHGTEPYNPRKKSCKERLQKWNEKAETSDFYKVAIETWTQRDVKKLKTAKKNNLNYEVIYKI